MKILHEFDYKRPESLEEALAILGEHGDKAVPLAGGTDVVVNMKYRGMLQLVPGAGTRDAMWPAAGRVPAIQQPEVIVSINSIDGLKGVSRDEDPTRIGPLTTMTEYAGLDDVPPGLMGLKDAATIMGSPLIRNRATIGGNILNARPAADTAVAVLALGAQFVLARTGGTRKVPASEFFTGPGKSVREPEELLTAIEIPTADKEGSAYLRVGNRRQLEIALVGAAAWLEVDGEGLVSDARIALGAVAPTPVLSEPATAALVGKKPGEETFAAAAAAARGQVKPIDDFRGSAAYRLELVESLVTRALEIAHDRIGKGGAAR